MHRWLLVSVVALVGAACSPPRSLPRNAADAAGGAGSTPDAADPEDLSSGDSATPATDGASSGVDVPAGMVDAAAEPGDAVSPAMEIGAMAATDVAVDAPATPGDGGSGTRMNGATCAMGTECLSGFCADKVCCNAACGGQCQTCNGPGTLGTCLPIAGDPQGGRPACAGAGTACAGTCNGTVGAVCTFPGPEKSCGPASCTNGIAQPLSACNGQGTCVKPPTVNCAPYACVGQMCAGGCSDVNPCAGDNYCEAGKCVPRLPDGSSCQNGGQCRNGQCAAGVCCDRACSGDCEACNLSGKVGVCSYKQGTACRDSQGLCDPTEYCSGSSSVCPSDQFRGAGYVCRPAQGGCDVAESCAGTSASCPPDSPGTMTCDASVASPDSAVDANQVSPDTSPDLSQQTDALQPDTAVGDAAATSCPGDVIDLDWNPPIVGQPELAAFGLAVPVWNGTDYAIAWLANVNSARLWVSRLSSNGIEVAGARSDVMGVSNGDGSHPHIGYSGSSYAVVYSTAAAIFVSYLDAVAKPIASPRVQLSGAATDYQRDPQVVWNPLDSQWGVSWVRDQGKALLFTRAHPTQGQTGNIGTVVSNFNFDFFPAHAGGSRMVWNGSNYVLAYGQGHDVVLAFLDRTGSLTSTPVAATSLIGNNPSLAGVAHNGSNQFAVTWVEGDAYFALANASGGSIVGTALRLSSGAALARVAGAAWTGSEWVAVWTERENPNVSWTHLWTARISPAGAVVPGSRRQVTCVSAVDERPYVTWGANKALVTYLRNGNDARLLLIP
jgi:hypothetical protein